MLPYIHLYYVNIDLSIKRLIACLKAPSRPGESGLYQNTPLCFKRYFLPILPRQCVLYWSIYPRCVTGDWQMRIYHSLCNIAQVSLFDPRAIFPIHPPPALIPPYFQVRGWNFLLNIHIDCRQLNIMKTVLGAIEYCCYYRTSHSETQTVNDNLWRELHCHLIHS